MESSSTAYSGSEIRWAAPSCQRASNHQRDLIHRSRRLCVADVAEGVWSVGNDLWTFLAFSARRHVAAYPQFAARKSAPSRPTQAESECRHRGQSNREDHGKGGVHGYDAGKKIGGRKRHLAVDTLGLILAVVVHAADIQDRDGAKLVFEKLKGCFHRLRIMWADGGYAGKLVQWVEVTFRWTLEIVKRSDDVSGFVVLPKRWIVERTFGWLGRYRRLSKDYEGRTDNSEAMILIAMTNLMSRRLAGRSSKQDF